jgi:hypothetical protein
MKKRKSKKKEDIVQRQYSYRKMSVGVLKGKVAKTARKIANGEIIGYDIIHNALLEMVREAYCRGYEQNTSERRLFKDMKLRDKTNSFKGLITEIQDIVNENK